MPNFTPRVNASRYDYPKYFGWYEGATAIAQGYNKSMRLREGMIVSLLEHYLNYCIDKKCEPSKDHFMSAVTAFCDRDMTTISRLVAMLEGAEPLEFKKPVQVNEMPGRERTREANQTKTVGGFLDQLRIDPSAPAPIAKPKGKLPPGYYERDNAIAWMRENHPNDLDNVDEFFDYLGVDPKYGPLYFLKVRQ